jgi:predicted amidohydrolase YtcJ
MDGGLPFAEAFVVEGDKFAYVGSEGGAREYASGKGAFESETDLGGRLTLPGFNDSHLHFVHYARSMSAVNLTGTKSVGEIKERMRAGLAGRKAGEPGWLVGEGWNQDFFDGEKRFPNRFDLDEVSSDTPIAIMRACFHIGVLNSAAMKIIGVSKEKAPSFEGLVGLTQEGEPDGVIKEKLLDALTPYTSFLDRDVMKRLIMKAQDKALEQGLTSLQSDDFGCAADGEYKTLFDTFNELEKEGKLRVRIAEQCRLQSASELEKFFAEGYRAGWGTDFFRISCVKILTDGSLGGSTAAVRQPYVGSQSNRGLMLFTQEELDELVLISQRNGAPVAIHAIGDRALEVALNSIERANAEGTPRLRHGIVHCQITDEGLLDRLAGAGVLAFVQPIFIDSDMKIVADRVGRDLAETSYAWKSMIDRGVRVSFGTDCPVEAFDTMPNIYSAVARKNITGDRSVYLPREKTTMQEAIYSYTVEGAYATGEERKKGAISAGKLADFIVLSKNLFEIDDEEILSVKVMETYVDGKLAYSRDAAR